MNILLFGDLHLTQQDLPECIQILEEIGMLANQHNVDLLIDLGDTFDSLKPSSLELDNFATFIRRLNKKLIIIAADSHESETEKQSILNHYGILNDTITVVKEYQDENYLYCGHFIVKEAKKNFGATKSKNELKYRYVFLGHQHQHEIIKPNICQIGSCRFINFDEAEDKQKIVAIIQDYRGDKERVLFIPLKSPYPMVSLELDKNPQKTSILPIDNDVQEQENGKESGILGVKQPLQEFMARLDSLDPKNKVRIVFKDYENWVNFLPFYQKYKEKFTKFCDKKDFIMNTNLVITKQNNLPLKESLINWMEQNKVEEKIKQILLEEIK